MICVALYVSATDERVRVAGAEALEHYGGDQIEVCVANRDIAAGEVLDESCLETKTWVTTLLPEDAVTEVSDAVGKQVSSSILQGEVISTKRFGTAIATLEIPSGLVAVSLPARDVQAVGGALTPGMKVDVYAVGASSTTRLVSEALIVATSVNDSGSSSSSSSTSWITIAVAPSMVEELVSAAENSDLYFVLPTETSADEHIDESTAENIADNTSASASPDTSDTADESTKNLISADAVASSDAD